MKRKGEIVGPQCYYSLLGVDLNALEKDMNTIYKQLVIRLHPDQNCHKDAAEAFHL
jgi:DnaJ-class molecular chaperone